ncbi:MAG TPA: amidohydrolase family protein [Stellaceae bacterium]|jgi:imidazolonepropionase-like amidohydrolase|nr:amidohydrolase family protein [Stellaceae bacterium]
MATTIFANCALLDGTASERREDRHVLIEGGLIREVSDRPIANAAAETVDLAGHTLMPGLIDAHVHVIAVDQALARLGERPASLVTLQAARVLEGMLQRGFTTVRDAGGADGGLAEAVEQGLVRGPRIFPSGRALSQTGGHGDLRPRTRSVSVAACACCEGGAGLARIADGVSECRRAARDELRKGATQIKIMASGGVASPYDPVWNLQYSEEEVRAIVEEARAWSTYVMAHAYTPEAIRRSIDFGVRSIEHGNLIDEATAELVASADAFVVPTLITFDALHRFGHELGFPEASLKKLGDVREAGLRSLEILQAADVKIGFGTDLLGAMHRHQSHEFAIRAEAMTPIEIIRSATTVNADLLNRKGEFGVIAPDARADLIAVDGNPLADIALLDGQGEHLTHIMKDGVFYKRP